MAKSCVYNEPLLIVVILSFGSASIKRYPDLLLVF